MFDETQESFVAQIAKDFSDIAAQSVFADYLEDTGNEFADYVRLWIGIQQSKGQEAGLRVLQQQRFEWLVEHPEYWQWDNFLAAREVQKHQDRLRLVCGAWWPIRRRWFAPQRASEQQLTALESIVGPLPNGFRSFVSQVADTWKRFTSPTQFIGVPGITRRLNESPEDTERTQHSASISMSDVMAGSVEDHTYETVLNLDTSLSQETGLLQLRAFPDLGGGLYLVLEGSLRGAILKEQLGAITCLGPGPPRPDPANPIPADTMSALCWQFESSRNPIGLT